MNIIYHKQVGFNLWDARMVHHRKVNRAKNENLMIVLLDAEKIFEEIQHHIMMKIPNKL